MTLIMMMQYLKKVMTQGKVLMMMVPIFSDDLNHDDAIFDKVLTQGNDDNHDDAIFGTAITQGNDDNHDDTIFDKVMTQGKSEDGAGKSSGGGEGGAKPSVFQVRDKEKYKETCKNKYIYFNKYKNCKETKTKGGPS